MLLIFKNRGKFMKKVKRGKNEALIYVLLLLMFVILQFVLQASTWIELLNPYKGVFTSLQYGVCLLMMFVNVKKGTRYAIALMSLSSAGLIAVIILGVKDAVPGLVNSIFFIITIIVISKYDSKREVESRTDFITGVYNRKGLYKKLTEKIKTQTI